MESGVRSIWEGTTEYAKHFPVLEGVEETEIAIVGGGITGLTAAMLLSDAGKKVTLLEAKKIGLGTTGNSTGNLYATVDAHVSSLREKWSSDVMKAVVDSRKAAMDLIESIVERYQIRCDFHRQPFTLFIEKPDKELEAFIEEEFDAMLEAGLHPEMREDAGLPYTTHKALRIENQAQFHPLKYVQQLADSISGQCTLYENSRVLSIDEENGILQTEKGTLKAEHILLATHTPVGTYMIQTLLAPYREFGIAATLNGKPFPRGIFWGLDSPKHSVRSFSDGDTDYVMVVGDKFKTGQKEDTEAYIAGLETYLKERLNTSGTKFVWGGQQYRPADELPYIGKHGKRVYFLTGFASDGLVYGTLAAMIVSDQVAGRPNPWEDIYKAGRFTPVRSAKNFIAENTNVVAQYLKDMPWNVDSESLSEIRPGEGKVISMDNQKLAVYKDENQQVHLVSAVCTHLKCIVHWNPSEKSWDCPCHGSRFDIDGKVIEGPAFRDLPGKHE